MKICIFIVLLIGFFVNQNWSQTAVTSEILQNVLFFNYADKTGSCFRVTINKKRYLITASHLIPKVLDNSKIQINLYYNGKWSPLDVTALIHSNSEIDIAVLDLNFQSDSIDKYDLQGKDYFVSQECFFIGFPLSLKMDDNSLNGGLPIPFVRRGIISGFISDKNDAERIFIDGHSNPGMSRGPIIIANKKGNRFSIVGVMKGYRYDAKEIKTKDGTLIYEENSGLAVGFSIRHVKEIISRKR